MYLGIDNSVDGKAIFYKWQNDQFTVEEKIINESGDLLFALQSVLHKENLNLGDLQGLAVLVGAGKFTGTRVAVTVANTLAYALNIPVVGVGELKENTLERIKQQTSGIYVSATYSGEPNIGKKKE
ncbi:MAG TPA: hypothetical protein VJH75_03815 [Patescibacteria group bacterium]|nr:hypothetical protein [Patescibacteria group bacterium]